MAGAFQIFHGDSFDEAYARMREALGPEAIVLRTAEKRRPGIWGWLGRTCIEIVAAPPEPLPQAPRPTAAARRYAPEPDPPKAGDGTNVEYYKRLIQEAQDRLQRPAPPPPAARAAAAAGHDEPAPMLPFRKPHEANETPDALRREMREMREMLEVLSAERPAPGVPPEFAAQYQALVDRGVTRKAAAALLRVAIEGADPAVLQDPRVFTGRLKFEITRRVRVTGGIALEPGRCKRVALCGATGVGKTTTLAKLAGRYTLKERARVAFITADTYRVAAVEQLRVYANIMGIPLEVVNDAREMAAAVRTFADRDLVLIDTAGGSQFNVKQIQEVKQVLTAARADETLLCVAANTQLEELRTMVHNFRGLGASALLLTKLDETRRFGGVFSVLAETNLPISYFTTGQNVPGDIVVARPPMVANLLLGTGRP